MGKSAILAIRIIGDATDAIAGFGEAEKAGKQFENSMGKLKDGVQVAGAAAGAALMAGAYGAIEQAQDQNKLEAQLGLDPAEAERLGGIAGSLYADAYGDSLGTVNEAIRNVIGDIEGMGDAADDELSGITAKVLSVAETFDQDLGRTTTAVGQLMRTGMAADADEALDIITKGLQSNARASEDLLDTFTEYPALFQRLGIDGETATGLINQGLAAGARNSDTVADALKEFQIRATDGSKASAAGFEALGLNAANATAQIALGGSDAAAGLQTVLDGLRNMEDPVARNAAAVALFGTKAEDLGGALFALDPSTAVEALGEVTGAADALNEAVSNDQEFEKLKRVVTQTFIDIGAAALPVIQPMLDGLREFAPILGPVAIALAAAAGAVTLISGAMKVYAAAQAIQTVAQWASNAAWLASPITWIVLAVVAAVALLITIIVLVIQNWDTLQAAAAVAWEAIIGWLETARDWLLDKIIGAIRSVHEFFDNLGRGMGLAFEGAVKWIRGAYDWLMKLVGKAIPGWVKDLMGMKTFSARMEVEAPKEIAAPRMLATAEETMSAFAYRSAPTVSISAAPAPDFGRLGGGPGDAPAPVVNNYYNVKVEGAIDPDSTARAIKGVLTKDGKSTGTLAAAGESWR